MTKRTRKKPEQGQFILSTIQSRTRELFEHAKYDPEKTLQYTSEFKSPSGKFVYCLYKNLLSEFNARARKSPLLPERDVLILPEKISVAVDLGFDEEILKGMKGVNFVGATRHSNLKEISRHHDEPRYPLAWEIKFASIKDLQDFLGELDETEYSLDVKTREQIMALGTVSEIKKRGHVKMGETAKRNAKDKKDSDTGNDVKGEVKEIVKYPLNQILYGPPGTGKTFYSAIYAVAIIEGRDIKDVAGDYAATMARYRRYLEDPENPQQIGFVTFHQSYGYEEFVEGIKPILSKDESGLQYQVVPGAFKEFCDRAGEPGNKDKNFVFIIDEINRGNISKILGELITLIEPTRRLGEVGALTARLPHQTENQTFGVPKNVYLLGTMNTADRSLTRLDTALRRRFSFVEMRPDPGKLINEGIKIRDCCIGSMLKAINERIEFLYDREHTIGHAYFLDLKGKTDIEPLAEIFKQKIIPLLSEYFYEDFEKIRLVLGDNAKTDSPDLQFILAENKKPGNVFLGPVTSDHDLDDRKSYTINENAFGLIESYMRIYKIKDEAQNISSS